MASTKSPFDRGYVDKWIDSSAQKGVDKDTLMSMAQTAETGGRIEAARTQAENDKTPKKKSRMNTLYKSDK